MSCRIAEKTNQYLYDNIYAKKNKSFFFRHHIYRRLIGMELSGRGKHYYSQSKCGLIVNKESFIVVSFCYKTNKYLQNPFLKIPQFVT